MPASQHPGSLGRQQSFVAFPTSGCGYWVMLLQRCKGVRAHHEHTAHRGADVELICVDGRRRHTAPR